MEWIEWIGLIRCMWPSPDAGDKAELARSAEGHFWMGYFWMGHFWVRIVGCGVPLVLCETCWFHL